MVYILLRVQPLAISLVTDTTLAGVGVGWSMVQQQLPRQDLRAEEARHVEDGLSEPGEVRIRQVDQHREVFLLHLRGSMEQGEQCVEEAAPVWLGPRGDPHR